MAKGKVGMPNRCRVKPISIYNMEARVVPECNQGFSYFHYQGEI